MWNLIYDVLIGWRCLGDWQSETLSCWLVQIKETAVWFWSKSAWLSQFGSDGDVLGFCLAVGELLFGSDRGVLGFYLAVAVWFWLRCAWVLFGCCSLVLIEVRLGFIWLLQFGSDRGALGFYLAVAVWFWSRCVGVLFGCCSLVLIKVYWGFIWLLQFGSDRGVLGFHFAVTWLHGLVSQLLEEFFWLRVIFCSLFRSFPLGQTLCPCACFVGLTCCFRFAQFSAKLWLTVENMVKFNLFAFQKWNVMF